VAAVSDGDLELILPPATLASGRCALCWEAFRIGDIYTTIWPKAAPRGAVDVAITVHPGCRAQLDEGDLGRIFEALARGLAVPLAVLSGSARFGA
jgi:hypothetical protein